MKQLYLILFFSGLVLSGFAQPIQGTTGLLNTPTATMQQDGTFVMGVNYLPEHFTPSTFSYDTGNYYFNLTFVPFLEVTYRMTLFKVGESYSQQDRSFGMKARLWKEGKYLPAFVLGGNDLYTSSSGSGNQYFGSSYAVASKSLKLNEHRLLLSLGTGLRVVRQRQLSGAFGGMAYSPAFLRQVWLMADYDGQAVNLGGSVLFFKHLQLNAFVNNYRYLVGGVGYRIFL